MNELDGFRAEIDRIDTELARLLELRFDLCEEIGRYKRMNGLPIENCEREKELVAARTEGMLSHRSDAVAVFRMIIRRAKRIQKEKLNLYLVGMPGSGKSRTARRLARAIEKPVADTDKLIIDKQGMSIDEIFDTHGEAFFREIESETLLGVAERGGHVVATGSPFNDATGNLCQVRRMLYYFSGYSRRFITVRTIGQITAFPGRLFNLR